MTNITRLQLRRGLAADWTLRNEILRQAEPGFEIDTGKIKYGDGTTPWNTLPYATGGGGGISISETKPSDPGDGDLWFDSETGDIFIYYEDGTSSQWVQTVSGLSGGTDLRTRLGALESRTTDEEALNITQDGRLTAVESLNTTQDSRLTAVEGVNTTQDGRLTSLEGYTQQSPNYIINGGFDIWQRSTSAAITAGAYAAADRWTFTSAGTGISCVQSRQTIVPNQSVSYSVRYQQSGNATSVTEYRARTWLEVGHIRPLIGNTVTLSFWYRSSITGTHTARTGIYNATGSGLDSTVNFTVTSADTWQYVTTTHTSFVNVTGFSVGETSAGVFIDIGYGAGTSSVPTGSNFYIAEVQLEAGSIATPFRRNAPSIQAELAACQRYYQRMTQTSVETLFGYGVQTTTTTGRLLVNLPVTLRAVPTSVVFSACFIGDQTSFAAAATLSTFDRSTTSALTLGVTFATAGAALRPMFLQGRNGTPYDAVVEVIAEL
jgi:hypothetical protein